MNFKKDRFSKNRGNHSRFLKISCQKCKKFICFYQKDGSGPLKRMYFDRVINLKPKNKELKCGKCEELLGIKYIYKKEKRAAYKIFQDIIKKKIISKSKLISRS